MISQTSRPGQIAISQQALAYSTPANDNVTNRNRLLARCESLLRRLINSHS
jgi:hypothetical protein